MRTLKESLLDDIESTMNSGSEWTKEIEKEKKELLKALSTCKNYKSMGFENGRMIELFVPNLLKHLGYNADRIYMHMRPAWKLNSDDVFWELYISLKKPSDNYKISTYIDYCKKVYMERSKFDKWNNIVKELIKPATKSIDTFKKLLDNVEKWHEEVIDKQTLLN